MWYFWYVVQKKNIRVSLWNLNIINESIVMVMPTSSFAGYGTTDTNYVIFSVSIYQGY